MVGRLILIATLALPLSLFAQRQQLQELQRDMAILQDQIRTTNEQLTALTSLVEQILDRANANSAAITSLSQEVGESVREQQKAVTAPIAGMGSQIESMATEFRGVRESVNDLNAKVSRVQTQLTDLRTAVTIAAAPPAPPGESELPPSISAATLFEDAESDMSAGRSDSALKLFEQFLTQHANTDLAPAAQYNIGRIHYDTGDFEKAREAFDLVLERFPENPQTPDARFMKGMCLVRTGSNRAAAMEFRALITQYPNTELAERAKVELGNIGYSAPEL